MTNAVKIIKPKRRTGPIPKLKGNTFPKHLLFIDTETHVIKTDKNHVIFPLRLGIAIYVELTPDLSIKKRHVLSFNTAKDFIDILKTYATGRKTLYVFAHNIKFDIMVLNLPLALHDHDITSKFPIINERLFIWRAIYKQAKILFLDTANYGIISVDQIGHDLGKPKLSVDFTNVDDDTLRNYCRNDVEILEEFMLSYIKFIHLNKLGSFKFTLASQSLAAWRTRFMSGTVYIHDDAFALDLERKSYHGGRTECFALGTLPEQPYYYLDVNSMYPYIMKTSNIPFKHFHNVANPDIDKLSRCVLKYYTIADVEIETNNAAFAYIFGDKLVFPTGRFRTTLQHQELSYAINNRMVKRCYGLSIYLARNLFGNYVDFFYNLKQESKRSGNKSWYTISKYFSNSLYGKMAQTGVIQEIVEGEYKRIILREEGHELGTFNYSSQVNWFGTIIREKHEGESSYSFPAAAGAITANARMLLWSYIMCAGLQNVMYTDTDSLIVNQAGYNNLLGVIDDYALGMLKLEKSSYYLTITGSKDYEFGDSIRHKGISPKAEQLTRDKWRALQFGGILPFMNDGFEGYAKAKYVIKERKEDYKKGYTHLIPNRVLPLIFAPNEEAYAPLQPSDPLVSEAVAAYLALLSD